MKRDGAPRLRLAGEPADCTTLSVVIPTRDRAPDLRRCLESVAGLDYPCWEVIVVDQSDGDLAEAVVGRFADDVPDLRYLRTADRGAARARNLGMREARGEIVALLDDDCTVTADWLWHVVMAFDRHPEAALVCGSVRDALLDDEQYVPSYVVPVERVLLGARAARRGHGFSAAMYVRRTLLDQMGMFDEHLGAGSRFLSSEDWDFTFRVLRAGFPVVETPTIVVDHYGGRSYASGAAARLLRGNAFSHGVVHTKLLRCLQPAALLLVASELAEDLRILRPLAPLLGRGPSNAGRLVAYAQGLKAGLRMPVDRRRLLYVDR